MCEKVVNQTGQVLMKSCLAFTLICDVISVSFHVVGLLTIWKSYEQKAAKKKKIHAFKSKMRLEEREAAQNKRQNAWQQFQSTKGRAKKVYHIALSDAGPALSAVA